MKLQTRLAVLVCKASGAVLRKLGRGGTNLPGKLALKIDKNILGELSRGVKVTVVTGTNGKTTTSRMIEQAFADAGLKYFSNKSGANLLTGIIAVFAQHSTLSGKCPYTHALIECDEAAFRKTSEYLPVECLVVNNIFRDQLDRYGEITHTLNAIREGITHVPNATLCLNADCSLTASLADSVPNKIVWFGVNVPIYKETAHELSDAPYCIHCKTEYEYDYITYGHLGGFRCPKCGYHHRIGARQRLLAFLDPESAVEIAANVRSVDPLGFVDSKPYPKRIAAAEAASGETDALIAMSGTLRSQPIVATAFEFRFQAGSMGSVVGERFSRAVDEAIRLHAPFVCFAASGGARMQEGLLSLMQMAKTTAAITRLHKAGLPFISVLTDPTMGGVSASFAFMGDVVIAEPKALVGFAGPRVIEQTVREKLPEGFQRAEFLLAKGQIDMIVDRREMRSRISCLTQHLMRRPPVAGA